MKTRTYILSGVAALALAAAAPSFAQVSHDTGTPNDTGPQYSTPAEHAQTEQLNSNAAQNGAAVDAQNAAQQQQYQNQQDQYQHQRAQYERDIHRYDEARYYFTDYPHPYPYRYEGEHLRRLYMIADPSKQLANAPIEGPDGQWVGRVRNVDIGPDGRPQRIEVALNRRVSVWVQPGDMRFDAGNRVLFTNLTRADLWNMPGSTYESAPM